MKNKFTKTRTTSRDLCSRPLTGLACAVLLVTCPLPATKVLAQSSTGPELRLFTSTVVEDIRRTSEAAETMEAGVMESIEFMDQQLDLYKASNCENAAQEDSGCAEMRRQLGQSYGTMLDAMSSALPEMQSAIERSRDGLQRSLVSQIGRGLSPSKLQAMMLNEGSSTRATRTARSAGTGGARLSQRFQQYYTLVAGSVGGNRRGQGALAVTASDIYLDMQEAAELIKLTSDEIDRSKIFIDLDQAMPGMTEQMEMTVEGVKRIVFGETTGPIDSSLEPPPVDTTIAGGTGGDFSSPLEF